MAYKIIRNRNEKYQTGREITAVLDSEADLTTLQANETGLAPGSLAIIADAGLPSYALNASGEWKSTDDDGSSGGGGANPNSIETYTGTVENVFTSNGIGLRGLLEQVEANAATVKLTIDATSINMGVLPTANICNTIGQDTPEITEDWLMVFALTNLTETMAGELKYGSLTDHNAALYTVRMLTPATEGQIIDAKDTVRDLPATLTIIRHPLPESTTGGNA